MEHDLLLTGIILDDGPVGEYDRRVSILTLERGRISAFLKGAKRSGKNPMSFLGPFCVGKFYMYEGKSSYTVKKAEIENRFDEVKSDLSNVAYGSYFLEVARYYSRENTDEADRVKLLYVALRALSAGKLKKEFIRLVYELKSLCLLGEYPNVFECTVCRKKEDISYFSLKKRSVVCSDCKDKVSDVFSMSPPVLKALMFIFVTPPEKLYTFMLSEKAEDGLREFADWYFSAYFPHRFKSLEYLDILTI